MRLSAAAELGIRGISVLVESYGQGPVALETICKQRKIAREYLVKIFKSLAHAGLITPVRGKHGGYMLARAPKDITVLEVIEAIEGPIRMNYCTHDPPQCDRRDCPMHDVWVDIQETVRRKLAAVNLSACQADKHSH